MARRKNQGGRPRPPEQRPPQPPPPEDDHDDDEDDDDVEPSDADRAAAEQANKVRVERQRREAEVRRPEKEREARELAEAFANLSTHLEDDRDDQYKIDKQERRLVGGSANILLKKAGQFVPVNEIFYNLNDRARKRGGDDGREREAERFQRAVEQIEIVYGHDFGVDPDPTSDRVIIPLDFGRRATDWPRLFREFTRAVIRRDEKEVAKPQKKKGGGTVINYSYFPTAEAEALRKELKTRQELEDGLRELVAQRKSKSPFYLAKRYRDLEMAHSQARRQAEIVLDRLMGPVANAYLEATEKGLYEKAGGVEGFRSQLRQELLQAQEDLIHKFTPDFWQNRVLFNTASEDVGRYHIMSGVDFIPFVHLVRRAWNGRDWDLPLRQRFKQVFWDDSETVKAWRLRRKLRDVAVGGRMSTAQSLLTSPLDLTGTFGATAAKIVAGIGLRGLEFALALPVAGVVKSYEATDGLLHRLQKWGFSKLFGKGYKPGLDTAAERRADWDKWIKARANKNFGKMEKEKKAE